MSAALNGRSILIVEDQFLAAINLEDTVRKAGVEMVELASCLEDAYELLDAITFDVAFLDLRLKDVDALPLGEELVKQGMPVIVYSGHAEQRCAEALPKAIILHKPATPRQILRAVEEALA